MDMNESAKQKVLQQLIDLMDAKSVDGLKSKSPKFMKVETNDPEMAKKVVQKVTEDAVPTESEMPMESENPEEMEHIGSEMPEKPDESEDDEDMKRLMEMYKQLK